LLIIITQFRDSFTCYSSIYDAYDLKGVPLLSCSRNPRNFYY
jgi:hypothetical protein